MIRLARPEDVPAILEIYDPYVRETAITFEYETPSMEAFSRRFEEISRRFPWIVWEEAGKVLGYAYAGPAFSRAAYDWDADLSIYLDRSARRHGLGRRLYGCLEELLEQMGFHNLYGIVTGDNLASCRFHEKMGYELLGVLKQTGWKKGQWHDVCWYGKRLRPPCAPGTAPDCFALSEAALRMMKRYSETEPSV